MNFVQESYLSKEFCVLEPTELKQIQYYAISASKNLLGALKKGIYDVDIFSDKVEDDDFDTLTNYELE